jgi:hypothetical protein
LALAPAAAGAGGCTIYALAAKNIVHDAGLFASDVNFRHRMRATAEAAWDAEHPTDPVLAKSKDYHKGFVDGYVAFLENGGPPGPAATPRTHYARNRLLNPAGHAGAELYLEGYAHGAAQAEATGEREVLVLPGGAAPPPGHVPPVVTVAPAPVVAPADGPPPALRAGEPLPAPRPEPARPML